MNDFERKVIYALNEFHSPKYSHSTKKLLPMLNTKVLSNIIHEKNDKNAIKDSKVRSKRYCMLFDIEH